MHFKFRHLQRVVGGFFLLACIIVVLLLVIVARGQRWFQPFVPYTIVFANGGGISEGASVMIQGLGAGRVRSLSLDESNRVKVGVRLFAQYADRIRTDSLAKLTVPMIGSARLEVDLGPQQGAIIPRGGTIPSQSEKGGDLDALIQSATDLVTELKDPKGDLMEALGNINGATGSIATGLAAKPGQQPLMEELSSAISNLDAVLGMLDEKSPDIQDAIVEARRGLTEANKVIRALQKSVFIRGHIERYLKEDPTLRMENR